MNGTGDSRRGKDGGQGDTVLVSREGNAVILEPAQGWPEGYVDSFAGVPEDFERPPQGEIAKCRKRG